MSAIERNFGDIARSLAVETALVEHPDLQNPASPPEELHSEEESVAETLLGAAAEIGFPVSNLTPALSEPTANEPPFILSIFESFYGFLAEIGIVSPVNNGEKPFHIPSELTSFFSLSPVQATHLASPDADPVTAEQTQPETQLALEDLLKDLAFQQEMIRASSVCDDLLFMAAQATLWSKTLKTIHTFSPTTAVEKARSVLEGKDTPPCLRDAASDYVHSHFRDVKLAFISAGIERYQRDPDPTLGRKQGLRDLCGFLENIVDRAFKAGETERLKEQMAGEVRKLVGANSTPQASRQPSVS